MICLRVKWGKVGPFLTALARPAQTHVTGNGGEPLRPACRVVQFMHVPPRLEQGLLREILGCLHVTCELGAEAYQPRPFQPQCGFPVDGAGDYLTPHGALSRLTRCRHAYRLTIHRSLGRHGILHICAAPVSRCSGGSPLERLRPGTVRHASGG